MHRFDLARSLRAECWDRVFVLSVDEVHLQVGYWDILWPQFIQGVSIGLVAVRSWSDHGFHFQGEDGNATSLFNMMRNIGGGIGISLVGTC